MDELDFLDLPLITQSPLAATWSLPLRPTILRAAPVVVDGLEFQIHPAANDAPHRAWRPVVAIRVGLPSWDDFRCAVAGEVIDYAALSPAADRVLATHDQLADVIGNPPDELFCDARGQRLIRLRRTPAAWLADLTGAVLVRSLAASTAFLRDFDAVVADDVKHGEAIQAALKRDYAGPSIRVAAAGTTGAAVRRAA